MAADRGVNKGTQRTQHLMQAMMQELVAPALLRMRLRPPHKQPVVDVAERVGHERLRLVMPPLAIYNKFVLVVPACSTPL